MNRGRITISAFLCFLMMMFLVISGCGSSSSDAVTGGGGGPVTAQDLIDVHTHATVSSGSASATDLVNILTSNGVSTTILVTFPRPNYQAVDNSSSGLITFFTAYSSSFRYMYGGSELEPLLFARGYNGTLPITSDLVYPNGDGGGPFTAQNISDFNAIRTDTEGASGKRCSMTGRPQRPHRANT
jgi:hypothetical protein